MLKTRLLQSPSTPADRHWSGRLRRLLWRRIWLPSVLYESIPCLYIVSGLIALLSAIFVPGRAWLLPWGIVLGCAAIHFGLGVLNLRRRLRRRRPASTDRASPD